MGDASATFKGTDQRNLQPTVSVPDEGLRFLADTLDAADFNRHLAPRDKLVLSALAMALRSEIAERVARNTGSLKPPPPDPGYA